MTNSREPNSARGNVTTRRRRKLWMLTPEAGFGGDGATVLCSEPDCDAILTIDTVFVDRIVPGIDGGRYVKGNVKPHCCSCSHKQGWKVRKGRACRPA